MESSAPSIARGIEATTLERFLLVSQARSRGNKMSQYRATCLAMTNDGQVHSHTPDGCAPNPGVAISEAMAEANDGCTPYSYTVVPCEEETTVAAKAVTAELWVAYVLYEEAGDLKVEDKVRSSAEAALAKALEKVGNNEILGAFVRKIK